MNYGKLPANINDNLSEQLVESATGMSLDAYTQQTTTTTAVLDFEKQRLKEQIARLELENQQRQIEMNLPFDETDEVRDFIVWLCGYTQRKAPPDQEEWNELTEETKKLAAKFALRTRTKRALAHSVADAHSKYAHNALSGTGISGNQTLIGNEETLSGCTSTVMGNITYTGATNAKFTTS